MFESVTLAFGGKDYEVKDGRLWGLAEAVEGVVSIFWLAPRLQSNDIPAARVYRAYAAALQYAGCKGVTAKDIQEEAGYKRVVEMAYELMAILTITSPQGDKSSELQEPSADDLATAEEESKKKAPRKRATRSG